MKFPVVGMQHRFPAAMVLSLIPPGTEFFLVREPENPHDANAIQVWIDGLGDILTAEDFESVDAAVAEQEKEPMDWDKPFMVGYIKAKSVNEEVVGAEVLAPRIDALIESGAINSADEIGVVLVYGESGRPAVQIVEEEGEPSEEAPIAEADDEDLEELEDEDEEEEEFSEDELADADDGTEEAELVDEQTDFTKSDRD